MKFNRYLVTGACGSIGSLLVAYLAETQPDAEILGLDNSENEIHLAKRNFVENTRVRFSLCDIRDYDALKSKMRGCDAVIHTAALKHVDLGEDAPMQFVRTNVDGVKNIIDAAISNHVSSVVFTSSDKAVSPTNVMGATKLMGERLVCAAAQNVKAAHPVFKVVRFGNVLGSRGSVVPIFDNCVLTGKALPITNLNMTRFVMAPLEAVSSIVDALGIGGAGDLLVLKMPALKIRDLAEAIYLVRKKQGCPVSPYFEYQVVGASRGEKLFEELLSSSEIVISSSFGKYFQVTGNVSSDRLSDLQEDDGEIAHHLINSERAQHMRVEEIMDFLVTNSILPNCHV